MSEENNKDNKKPAVDGEPLLLTEEVNAEQLEKLQAEQAAKDAPSVDAEVKPAPAVEPSAQRTQNATTAATAATPPPKAGRNTKQKPQGQTLGYVAVGVAVLSLLVAGGVGYQGQQQQVALEKRLQAKQSLIDSQTVQIQTLAKQFQTTQNQLTGVQSGQQGLTLQLDNMAQVVAANQRRIDEVAGTERSDWQLAEVEYLLRLANQRLMMSGEVRGSKALLQSADKVLLELDDIHLITVRDAIAKDIAALNRADTLDMEGLYLRVASLAENLDYLELRSDKRWQARPTSGVAENGNEDGGMWQVGLDKALATLNELVVIRSSEQRVLPQMNDVEIMQLRQGMHYLVEQAKFAVMSGRQQLYDVAIAGLQRWLRDYYDAERPITASALRELEALQGMQISQQWPDISASLDALQMLVKSRLGLPAKQSGSSSSADAGTGEQQ